MEIETREFEDVVILDVDGEIDLYNAPDLKEHINAQIQNRHFKVIINMDRVSYIDSSGIGALISCLSNLKKHQGGLKIIKITGSVGKVFQLTRLTSFFDVYESEEEARSSFS